jgi:hypothetical protein
MECLRVIVHQAQTCDDFEIYDNNKIQVEVEMFSGNCCEIAVQVPQQSRQARPQSLGRLGRVGRHFLLIDDELDSALDSEPADSCPF